MNYIKETKRRPRLTSMENVPKVEINKPPKIETPKVEIDTTPKKWNLNIILLVGFIVFLIFFLYNCKYGFFQKLDIEPYAFNS